MRSVIPGEILLSCLLATSILPAWAEAGSRQAPTVNEHRLNFSGYANVVAEAPSGARTELVVDEVSLIVAGKINQWVNPFTEVELSGATIIQDGETLFSDVTPRLILERIFNESHLTDSLALRIGKTLTPVGDWNSIHAAPLVMTTTRPMTTYRGFNEFTSGITLIYTDNRGTLPEIQLYVQPDGEIRPKPRDKVAREYRHVAGLHVNWVLDLDDKFGLSLQRAHVKDTGEQQILAGFNFNRNFGRLSFETEAFITHLSGTNAARQRGHEWGTYVLGAYSPDDRWRLLGSYEYFADRDYTTAAESALVGVNFRAAPSSILKLEYVKQYGQKLNTDTGLFGSFSVFF